MPKLTNLLYSTLNRYGDCDEYEKWICLNLYSFGFGFDKSNVVQRQRGLIYKVENLQLTIDKEVEK